MNRRSQAIVHQHLRRILTIQIRDELKAAEQASPAQPDGIPSELLAEFIAGSFIMVLNWWISSDGALSARDVDDLFLELVIPALANAHSSQTTPRVL